MMASTSTVFEIPLVQKFKEQIHFLSIFERWVDAIISCSAHNWGFPVTTPDMKSLYQRPYNAHQACTECGRTRMYNFKTMTYGPMFEKRN